MAEAADAGGAPAAATPTDGAADPRGAQTGGGQQDAGGDAGQACAPADAPTAAAAAAAPPSGADAPRCEPLRALGFDTGRRGGGVALDAATVALPGGSGVLLLELASLRQRLLPARDGGGVGALAVHPQRSCFAVAEKCAECAPNM
jgi:hypothetical protein